MKQPSICLFRMLLLLALAPAVVQSATLPLLPTLLDLRGGTHELGRNEEGRVRVLVFLGSECPVSRAGVPTLNRLAEEFATQGGQVELFGVWSDATVPRAEAARHFEEWKAAFPVLHDSARLLARALGPTHVPEAFVLGADGGLVYRGAIDNSFEAIGHRRVEVDKHYLADAIRAAIARQPAPVAFTKSVGCFFEAEPKNVGSGGAVTYTRDIAPIIFTRCMNCHRDGQSAPFPLANYAQAAKRARQIARVTEDRVMPPWIPSGNHERFVGERWLTDRERELFRDWAAAGAPEGNPDDLPPTPQFLAGWGLGKPDLIVRMAQPFIVRADGPDILQNFVIPIPITEDKLVAAIEFHPGNARVVHHAVLFLDDKGVARKLDAVTPEPGYENFGGPGFLPSGALGGWSAGNTARRLPGGMGRYLKKGSDLVVQTHYHPTGKVEVDQSEVGIYFVDKPVAESLKEPAKLVGSIWVANYEMDIPAGEPAYRRGASYTLPRDIILVGVVPHMHLLGKTMNVTATTPDGKKRTLIEVPRWDYNWQDEYYYERPFKLPAGTRLDVEAVFDNSAGNPGNPNSPPRRVSWGEGTLNEMLYCFFLITAEKTEDTIHTIFHNLDHDSKQPRAKVAAQP